jgi:hexokinase
MKNLKTQSFISKKVKMGVGLCFSYPLYIWVTWDMVEKNTQSFRTKFRFSPIAPGCTST